MITTIILFFISLIVLARSSQLAIRFASKLSKEIHISEFIISFFFIAFITILPETVIGIISAIKEIPSLGAGTLIGSNVADLSLIFGIIILASIKGLKLKKEDKKENFLYSVILLVPLLLALDGNFSRIDGLILVFSGIYFYYRLIEDFKLFKKHKEYNNKKVLKYSLFLILSLAVLVLSAYFTVKYGSELSKLVNIKPLILGSIVIALGTTLPELMFSLKSIREKHSELGVGDLFGTVLWDGTIALGVIALINPFSFMKEIMIIPALFMFLASLVIDYLSRRDKLLSKRDGVYLILFYIVFLIVEFFVGI